MVIGASGQIGSELTMSLRQAYGSSNVFATDIKNAPSDVMQSGPFSILDMMDVKQVSHFVIQNKISQIYLLAAVLSGNAEKIPMQAWDINMKSLLCLLNLAKEVKLNKFFWPSSIAVFGPTTPRINTPQHTIMEPTTVYGISKLAGERWMEYYYQKYGLDTRSIRYPGLISYKTEAGGGTTDYAVEIFYEAVKNNKYECFLSENTPLPMMFMDDAIKATISLMESDASNINIRSSYNLAGLSFTPKELSSEIARNKQGFEISYKPDFRQAIADSWPESIDDSEAVKDWGACCEYDLKNMTKVMLREVGKKLK